MVCMCVHVITSHLWARHSTIIIHFSSVQLDLKTNDSSSVVVLCLCMVCTCYNISPLGSPQHHHHPLLLGTVGLEDKRQFLRGGTSGSSILSVWCVHVITSHLWARHSTIIIHFSSVQLDLKTKDSSSVVVLAAAPYGVYVYSTAFIPVYRPDASVKNTCF